MFPEGLSAAGRGNIREWYTATAKNNADRMRKVTAQALGTLPKAVSIHPAAITTPPCPMMVASR